MQEVEFKYKTEKESYAALHAEFERRFEEYEHKEEGGSNYGKTPFFH